MKKSTWRKQHKWFGLILSFFILMFCLSGIVLNHRSFFADHHISRAWLPSDYLYKNWNNGLLRGTLAFPQGKDSCGVLLYGNAGIFLTNRSASAFEDFSQGLPYGADYRNIRGMALTPDKNLFAAGQFGLYRHDGNEWQEVTLPLQKGERISDITTHGDSLIVVGRSYLYCSTTPYHTFHRLTVKTPASHDGKVSLFRTVWLLHSGELFGTAGKLLMDMVAILLIVLTLSGIAYWLLPKHIRRLKRSGRSAQKSISLLSTSLSWHDKAGRKTILLTLFVALTGWCLRPPVLIALVYGRVPAIPFTKLDSSNAWNDNLRMLRYDEKKHEWLLSSSEGFYVLPSLNSVPEKMSQVPPVSVMGLNVWQRDVHGNWLTGSFSGMYVWNRETGIVTDYFTGETALPEAGAPFGKRAISGYSSDFPEKECIVEYTAGTHFAPMPQALEALPISLWNFAQEIHTGRIYTVLGPGTLLFIFIAGAAATWCLITGYAVRKKR